jgi:hypothetical protein
MSVDTYTRDNLLTNTVHLVTASELQLESGQSVVRGEVLKKGTTGLVALAATTDTPYTIALETVDATSAAKNITYMNQGSVLASELTFSAGTIANFRDKFFVTPIRVEE